MPFDASYEIRPPLDGPFASLPEADRLRTVGSAIDQLLVLWHIWVRRRVQAVRFTDLGSVRLHTSVDFLLPAPTKDERLEACAEAVMQMAKVTRVPVIPLGSVGKDTRLTSFDLWDEDDRRLPLMRRTDAARVAGNGLVALAEAAKKEIVGSETRTPLPEEVNRYFLEIADRQRDEAEELLQLGRTHFPEPDHIALQISELAENDPRRELLELVGQLYGHGPEINELMQWRQGTLAELAGKLAEGLILLVPLEGDLYRRRVIKYSYEESVDRRNRGRGVMPRIRYAARACSWLPMDFAFYDLQVGTADSYHFEVEAPDYTEIVKADLTADGRPVASDTDRSKRRYGHVQLDQRQVDVAARGVAGVRLRAARGGLLNAAPAAGIVIAALFWLGTARLSKIDQASAAATLLAVPTLAVAFLVRPGEHAMASAMLAGVRTMLALSGLCLFFAAGAIAGGFKTRVQAQATTAATTTTTTSTGSSTTTGVGRFVGQFTAKTRSSFRRCKRRPGVLLSAGRLTGTGMLSSHGTSNTISTSTAPGKPAPYSGLYLDDIWFVCKILTTVLAAGLLLSRLLPPRPA